MKYFSVLMATFFLSIGSSFGQTQTSGDQEIFQVLSYRGCCSNYVILAPSAEDLDMNKDKSGEILLDITDPELSSNLSASPNPTRGMISVVVPANMIGMTIQVCDMTGRIVGEPIPIQTTTQQLTIEGESGMYLIMIQTDKEILTERVLLETN